MMLRNSETRYLMLLKHCDGWLAEPHLKQGFSFIVMEFSWSLLRWQQVSVSCWKICTISCLSSLLSNYYCRYYGSPVFAFLSSQTEVCQRGFMCFWSGLAETHRSVLLWRPAAAHCCRCHLQATPSNPRSDQQRRSLTGQDSVMSQCVILCMNFCVYFQPSSFILERVAGWSQASDSVWAALYWMSCWGGVFLWGVSLSSLERAEQERLSWLCSSVCLCSTPHSTEDWTQVSECTIMTSSRARIYAESLW